MLGRSLFWETRSAERADGRSRRRSPRPLRAARCSLAVAALESGWVAVACRGGVTARRNRVVAAVVFVVAGGVVFGRLVVRCHTFVLAWLWGFRPATLGLRVGGRCLTTHPQLRVWVVKHLKEGCGGWLAMACGCVGVVWDGEGIVDCGWSVVVFWSLRSIADGSGSSGHGSPLAGTRGPTTSTLFAVRPCRWRPSSSPLP